MTFKRIVLAPIVAIVFCIRTLLSQAAQPPGPGPSPSFYENPIPTNAAWATLPPADSMNDIPWLRNTLTIASGAYSSNRIIVKRKDSVSLDQL